MRRSYFYINAFLLAVACSAIFFPGAFSTDSFDQWGQAVSGKYSSWHPVALAFVMKGLNPIFGKGGVLVFHQLLYWFGLALFFDTVLRKRSLVLFLWGFFPPVFMLSLTVWKDTSMMIGLMWAAISIFNFFEASRYKKVWLVIALISLWYSSVVRMNGFIPVAIIIFFASLYYFMMKWRVLVKSITLALVATMTLTLTFSLSNSVLLSVSKAKIVSPLPTLMLWDVAGIKHNIGERTPVPDFIDADDRDSSKWIDNYHSWTCDFCWMSGVSCGITPDKNKDMVAYWISNIKEHPKAYIKHRKELAKTMLGLNGGAYYAYHPYDDQNNREGFRVSNFGKKMFDLLFSGVALMNKMKVYQPIFYLCLSFFFVIFLLIRQIKTNWKSSKEVVSLILCFSGFVSEFSLLFISVAADYRYSSWLIMSSILITLVFFYSFVRRSMHIDPD